MIVQLLDVARRMQGCRPDPKFSDRFDGHDLMPHGGQRHGVASGTGADIEHPAWRLGDQMHDIFVHSGKAEAVIAADQRFGLFRIALCPTYAN
jgi:hypothetical protein